MSCFLNRSALKRSFIISMTTYFFQNLSPSYTKIIYTANQTALKKQTNGCNSIFRNRNKVKKNIQVLHYNTQ